MNGRSDGMLTLGIPEAPRKAAKVRLSMRVLLRGAQQMGRQCFMISVSDIAWT